MRLSRTARSDRPPPGSRHWDNGSHDVIGREVAGGFLADFDLQGRVADAEALPQLRRRRQQEFVAGMAAGEDEMRGQGVVRRAQRPDMQVMHGGNAGAGAKIAAHRVRIDRCRHRVDRHGKRVAQQAPGRPYDHGDDPQTGERIEPEPAGVTDDQAGSTTPAETAASAIMCRNAPRMLRSPLRPEANRAAVTPLTTMPTAATIMTVPLATGSG